MSRSVAGDATLRVGLSYLCAVPVPPKTTSLRLYKRISESRHCTLTRNSNGKIRLTNYSMIGTFINGVRVKFMRTAPVEDGDVVALISCEDGPTFTFHTQLSHCLLESNDCERDGLDGY